MKKIKLTLMGLIVIAFTSQSCVSDLDVTPEDSLSGTTEDFYKSTESYEKAIAGIYGNLSLTGTFGAGSSNIDGIDAGTSQYGRVLWYMQNLSTDEVIWSYENDPGTREIQRNIWTPSNVILRGMYSRAMFQVILANEFLRQSTPEAMASRGHNDATLLSDVTAYRAEARALRALAYYHLMDLFGKVTFNTEDDAVGVPGIEYSREQIYAYLESELTEIIPSLAAPRSNESGRLDQAFARMILAKMYLNSEVYIGQNRYADCVTQCNEIINGGYTLASNYKHNFTADNNLSPEMIFAIQSDGEVTQNYGPTTVMINGQVGSIENNGASMGVNGWGGALRLRKQFVQKFEGSEFSSDVRNSIISGSRPIDIADVVDQSQGYILFKYSNITSAGVPAPNTTFVDTDFPLFRLGDVYLMYAECALRGAGDAGTALGYVNALRTRANGQTISAGQLTLDFMIDERSRELHWEGHRRQDLIRFGKYTGGSYNWAWKGNASNGLSISSHLSLYPIPQASLAANPNLTQNSGY
uniref:RagB/SusD family nutrient uptake outer membrane protein n=1 Tax=Flavobacterium sp. TaxID=239 RepID=UPI00404AFE0A